MCVFNASGWFDDKAIARSFSPWWGWRTSLAMGRVWHLLNVESIWGKLNRSNGIWSLALLDCLEYILRFILKCCRWFLGVCLVAGDQNCGDRNELYGDWWIEFGISLLLFLWLNQSFFFEHLIWSILNFLLFGSGEVSVARRIVRQLQVLVVCASVRTGKSSYNNMVVVPEEECQYLYQVQQ